MNYLVFRRICCAPHIVQDVCREYQMYIKALLLFHPYIFYISRMLCLNKKW